MATESSKKLNAASLAIHSTLGEVNRLIASESLQEEVIGKRLRSKLLSTRNAIIEIVEAIEDR